MIWILSLLRDQKLDTCYSQFMQIHMEGCCLYGFDQQKVFGARYMAKNPPISQEHKKYDDNNMEHRGNAVTKR